MCSGRVDPSFVIQALKTGLDGVIVMGCHLGDCHYIDGNYEAEMKFATLQKLLEPTGLVNRIRLEWVSASEGVRFGEVIKDFTEQIRSLGPSPLRDKENSKPLIEDLNAMEDVVQNFRLRALIARERKITESGNIYERIIPIKNYQEILTEALKSEFIRSKIYLKLKSEPLSVKELSRRLALESSNVLKQVVVLRQRGKVALDRVEGVTPYYTAIGV
jgi:coenzyme F420-reducing hydrogenase delta subunit